LRQAGDGPIGHQFKNQSAPSRSKRDFVIGISSGNQKKIQGKIVREIRFPVRLSQTGRILQSSPADILPLLWQGEYGESRRRS
jgi:hypothetical protein